MFNIVLHEPRIPGNVGTIGRLAFALNCTSFHLIKPYGFGRYYWEKRYDVLDLIIGLIWMLESMKILKILVKNPFNDRHFLATTKTKQVYFDVEYKTGDYFILEEKMLDFHNLS